MIYSTTKISTVYGEFTANYHISDHGDCLSLIYGINNNKLIPLVRQHSSCLFSESFCANDCECNLKLQSALKAISKTSFGILLYQYQEGRGIGLKDKIRVLDYEQKNNATKEDSFVACGFGVDERNYLPAVNALKDLNCYKIVLLSEDSNKESTFLENGIEVVRRCGLNNKSYK